MFLSPARARLLCADAHWRRKESLLPASGCGYSWAYCRHLTPHFADPRPGVGVAGDISRGALTLLFIAGEPLARNQYSCSCTDLNTRSSAAAGRLSKSSKIDVVLPDSNCFRISSQLIFSQLSTRPVLAKLLYVTPERVVDSVKLQDYLKALDRVWSDSVHLATFYMHLSPFRKDI